MTNCMVCGEDLWGADHSDLISIGKESIYACMDCHKVIDKNLEEGKGKYVINRCKSCGHITGVHFIKYKKRGRPAGKRTDPVKAAERKGIKRLETFA